MTPAEQKASELHLAKVCEHDAAVRRSGRVHDTLIQWAANARRRAAAIDLSPAQGRLAL